MLFAVNLIFPAIVFVVAGIVGAVLSILLPIETKPTKVPSSHVKVRYLGQFLNKIAFFRRRSREKIDMQ